MLFRLRSFFFFFFFEIQPRFKRNFVSRIDSSRIHRSLCTLSRWNRIELTGSHFRGCFSLCFSAVFSRLGPSRVISFRVTLFDTTLYRHGSFPLSISWQSYYIVAGEQANNASFMERKSFQFRRDSKLFFFFFLPCREISPLSGDFSSLTTFLCSYLFRSWSLEVYHRAPRENCNCCLHWREIIPPPAYHTLAREGSNRLADRNIPRRFVFDLS